MDLAASSVCDDYIKSVNPEEYKQTKLQEEDEADDEESTKDSATTEGSNSTGTSSRSFTREQCKKRVLEMWYTFPEHMDSKNIKIWTPGNTKVDELRRLVRKTLGKYRNRINAMANARTIGTAKVP